MNQFDMNIEELVKKWQSHHLPPDRSIKDVQWYKTPTNGLLATTTRKRRTRRGYRNADEKTAEFQHAQKQFSLLALVQKHNSQEYAIKFCKHCQNGVQYQAIQSVSFDKKEKLHSHTISISDCDKIHKNWKPTTKTILKDTRGVIYKFAYSIMYSYIKSKLQNVWTLCMQSHDVIYLQELAKKSSLSIMFTHNSTDFISILLTYLYIVYGTKRIPYIVLADDYVSSSLLRFIMTNMRFLFVSNAKEDMKAEVVVQMLCELLKQNNHIIIPINSYEDKFATRHIFHHLLNCCRDGKGGNTLLVPTSVSIEKISTSSAFTFFDLVSTSFQRTKNGLVHLNISKAKKLKSILKVSADMNNQDTPGEENNLITRHLNYDIHESYTLLPSQVLAFLLITKYRHGVEATCLMKPFEALIMQIQECNGFVGFTGNVEDTTWHGIENLIDLKVARLKNKVLTPILGEIEKSNQLFDLSSKVLHYFIPKCIIAAAILACLGGAHLIKQGNDCGRSCTRDQIMKKAEMLGEIVSYLFDFSCSFSLMEELLLDVLDTFVTIDVLQRTERPYENQRHEKLVQSLTLSSCWEDTETLKTTSKYIDIEYTVNLNSDVKGMLLDYSSYIQPFVEISFLVILMIKEQPQDVLFSSHDLHIKIKERFDAGTFKFGELITPLYILKVLEYLFEKEFIDDREEESFVLGHQHIENANNVLILLKNLSMFRMQSIGQAM